MYISEYYSDMFTKNNSMTQKNACQKTNVLSNRLTPSPLLSLQYFPENFCYSLLTVLLGCF